jgi:hypothetical protein
LIDFVVPFYIVQVIQHSQSTRKAVGGSLIDHFKFLTTMGPTELDKEIKSRFLAWDTDKTGALSKDEMRVQTLSLLLSVPPPFSPSFSLFRPLPVKILTGGGVVLYIQCVTAIKRN